MPHSLEGPPTILEEDLEVGPDDWKGRAFYFLMNALVIPRPIGWISTISASRIRNLAPYSHFNLMGSNPFYLAFASTGVKDSVTNLREVPEFVANIVSMSLLERMNFTACDFPAEDGRAVTDQPTSRDEAPVEVDRRDRVLGRQRGNSRSLREEEGIGTNHHRRARMTR